LNCHVFLAFVWGEGAAIEFREPWMTVLVKGVAACESFSARTKPPGMELNVRVTVFGFS
jgi:hypothetical protein